MEKIKSFFSSLGGYLVTGLIAVLGIVFYAFIRKQEENEALKARLALVNTQKEVDLIETEIKQASAQREQTQQELETLNKDLALVAQKRQVLKDTRTDAEIEEYWNKKDE